MKGLRLLNSGQWNKPPVLTAARRIVFAGLLKHFPWCSLGDAADFLNGTSYDTGKVSDFGNYPIIRISNITDPTSRYLWTTEELPKRFWVKRGDLLVSWSASFKSILWTGPEGYLNQHIFKVTEREGYNRRFLRHAIEASFDEMQENVVGIGMMHLRRADFLGHPIPVPPPDVQASVSDFLDAVESGTGGARPSLPSVLAEQRRIVARIDSLDAKIEEARKLREKVQTDLSGLLNAAYYQIADNAPRRPLGEMAPLDRRPVTVDFHASYPQVAVRSFGRGTFHKPPLIGSEVTWEKPFLVKAGDILVSNIKAWEGAIAVAGPDDDGRVGSHRYLTCVARPGIATARFVCYHLLTQEGLYEVGEASPGTADRNRTLNSKAFLQIPVPMPEYQKQLWFDRVCQKVDSIAQAQSESSPELSALLPSILDKAFKGEL